MVIESINFLVQLHDVRRSKKFQRECTTYYMSEQITNGKNSDTKRKSNRFNN